MKKPVHMFLLCHILTTPIDKQGLDTFEQEMLECGAKSQISNYELSRVKRSGFGWGHEISKKLTKASFWCD